jgi:hypothetical protein
VNYQQRIEDAHKEQKRREDEAANKPNNYKDYWRQGKEARMDP